MNEDFCQTLSNAFEISCVVDKSWLIQECPCLKPDWFGDMKPFSRKNEYISSYKRRSKVRFPKTGRSETGL